MIKGRNRAFPASLLAELVEPNPRSPEDQKALLDSVYETLQRTNASKPPYACITKEYIMFTTPDMPFARTDKNTIKRRATVVLYEKEIEKFYEALESGDGATFETNIDAASPETAVPGIRDVLKASLPSNDVLAADDDLFHAGLDSVLTIRVARCLRSAAEKYDLKEDRKSALLPQLVYANPTINQLSRALYRLEHDIKESSDDLAEQQAQSITAYRTKYSANWPQSKYCSDPGTRNGNTVIMTGSTGSLGTYLLETLVHQQHVKEIYWLNRVEDGLKRQAEVSKLRGLLTEWSADRVHFLKADLSKPRFGLDQTQYDDLLTKTTNIIHSQWPVNFNYGITSFEPQIQGVRELINFYLMSEHAPSLFFVSTVATVGYQKDNESVPEAPNQDLTTAIGGYGASKLASELILQDAFEKSGLNGVVCRVGQIAGPVLNPGRGMWAKQEWVPTVRYSILDQVIPA